jgi:hypothetical protein
MIKLNKIERLKKKVEDTAAAADAAECVFDSAHIASAVADQNLSDAKQELLVELNKTDIERLEEEINIERAAKAIMELAESLTITNYEVFADDVLETLKGMLISEEKAGNVAEWLST